MDESTVKGYGSTLSMLVNDGANLYDPETVKSVISKRICSDSRKWNLCKAYTAWLKLNGGTWKPPIYKPVSKIPWIPQEREIDDLIAGCNLQMATVLQTMKETAARASEVW